MSKKLNVLFLCTGNSCRSQMAEGWARHLKGSVINAWSAGIETHGLNPNAVKVMAEAGVDISNHQSKKVDDLRDVDFDVVVTVCGHANETCQMWLGGKARVVHVGFDDPPALARELAAKGATAEEQLDCYRRVRDEIKAFVGALPEALETYLKMRKELEVFDPPMCCSSGVCGTKVNTDLLRFAGDLEFLKQNGVSVKRYNLSSEPAAFVQDATVKQTLTAEGNDCLPLVLIDGAIVSKGRYPARAELLKATELVAEVEPENTEPVAAKCRPGCCCG